MDNKQQKDKKECPECGDEFLNLGAHMVKHENEDSASENEEDNEDLNTSGNNKVTIEAVQDTQTADGTFIPEGERIEVSKHVGEKLLNEPNPQFKKVVQK